MSDIYLSLTETPSVVTLSQPVISGALSSTVTVANTVTVALDANSLAALESVTVTVGNVTIGSAVTIAGFSTSSLPPSTVTVGNTVTVSGTVTANVPFVNNDFTVTTLGAVKAALYINDTLGGDGLLPIGNDGNGLPIKNDGYALQVANDQQAGPLSISGTVTANVDNGTISIVGAVRDGDGNTFGVERDFPISGTVTANGSAGTPILQGEADSDFSGSGGFGRVAVEPINQTGDSLVTGNSLRVSGTVTVGNSVTIGSLPVQLSTTTIGGTARLNVTLSSATTVGATVPSYGNLYGGSDGTNFRAISVDSSGRTVVTGSVSVANLPSTQTVAGTVTANISGTVPVSGTFWQSTQPVSLASTTVTVSSMPSGSLTTRFGSVTTANTSQLTGAVTNSARKYLLVQNISSSTATIGIGFSPTTTQGIQLTAGAGLTFDAFCPTGGVWWLSSTTGSNWSILEG